MSYQYEEDYFPQSELQNCFAEAQMVCGSMERPQVTGEGRFLLERMTPYFCRSTDAYAGSYCVEAVRVQSLESPEAVAMFALAYEIEEDVRVTDSQPPTPIAVEVEVEDDGVPF